MSVRDHRSHSRPLDMHAWSDHPEINILVDKLWHSLDNSMATLISKGNRKGTDPKRLIKVLMAHLYATFLDDPHFGQGSRSANAYAPTSRYNSLLFPLKLFNSSMVWSS